MKKLLFILLATLTLTACGAYKHKAYNSQIKQVELGMTKQEIVTLMGDKYENYTNTTQSQAMQETIGYKDKYHNLWLFQFDDRGELIKWYKDKWE